MTFAQWLAVAGAGSGSLGSIITAFAVNRVLFELNLARSGLQLSVEQLAGGGAVPIFDGLDRRFNRATLWGALWTWTGVLFIAAGFVLQAASVVTGP